MNDTGKWKNLGLEPNPGSDSDLDLIENSTGYTLPSSFRSLVLYCDSGSPQTSVFSTPSGQETAISEFFSVKSSEPNSIGFYIKQRLPPDPKLLAIARDAGDWLICLDYTTGNSPSVTLYIPEREQRITIAPSFEAFIRLLHS